MRCDSMLLDWFAAHPALRFAELVDPLMESRGFPARSLYVEGYWLPVLGPSSVQLLRRLDLLLAAGPVVLSVRDLSAELGIRGTGRASQIVRTMVRLTQFHLATAQGTREDGEFLVRRHLPPLSYRQRAFLPESLRAAEADARAVLEHV